jgi:ArsR family transcriptional regulator
METSKAIAALVALAHESRLEIFRLLVQAGTKGLPAGQIGERLGLPSTTLSFHLNQLKHAGLVTFHREGRSLIYAAAYSVMNALLSYMTENCCGAEAASCGLDAPDPATCKPKAPHETSARARVR